MHHGVYVVLDIGNRYLLVDSRILISTSTSKYRYLPSLDNVYESLAGLNLDSTSMKSAYSLTFFIYLSESLAKSLHTTHLALYAMILLHLV